MEENIIKLPITKALSIPHDVVGDFGACKFMRPSIEGSVLLQVVQFIVLVAGVKNVIAKQLGSNNLLNNARQFVL
jgi:small subunit ribosomal protein S5